MVGGHETGTKPIAVSMGDPAGIGLEITLKAWCQRRERALPPFILFANADTVAALARATAPDVEIGRVTNSADAARLFATQLPVFDIPLETRPRPGSPDARNASGTIAAIERAVEAVFANQASAVVTNPIAKSVLKQAGFAHPGHTEFLAHLAAKRTGTAPHPVMMLAAEELRVVPLTIHIALAEVPSRITQRLLADTARILARALARDFGIVAPRIAVAGLNPHAGEAGTMGREEIETIIPALDLLRSEGMAVKGPFPADTLFHAGMRPTYDAVLAMYHDQALIPLKTLDFDRGVNITLGLPFVRTSPDHGTAFDIAGKELANPESFVAALRQADAMSARRRLAEDAGGGRAA